MQATYGCYVMWMIQCGYNGNIIHFIYTVSSYKEYIRYFAVGLRSLKQTRLKSAINQIRRSQRNSAINLMQNQCDMPKAFQNLLQADAYVFFFFFLILVIEKDREGGVDGCEGEFSPGALPIVGRTILIFRGAENVHGLQIFLKTVCVSMRACVRVRL